MLFRCSFERIDLSAEGCIGFLRFSSSGLEGGGERGMLGGQQVEGMRKLHTTIFKRECWRGCWARRMSGMRA